MILLIDIDGVSVRWCQVDSGDSGMSSDIGTATLEEWPHALSLYTPTRVVACATRDAPLHDLLAFCRTRWQLDVYCPTVPMSQMSLTRWAALVGAREVALGGHVVIHADRTTVVDGIDGHGQPHVLGALPGMASMQEALYTQTQGIQRAAHPVVPAAGDFFAINTAENVQAGVRVMSATWVDAVVRQFEVTLGASVTVWLTGPCATEFPSLVHPVIGSSDLVLRGLQRLAKDPS